MKPKNNVLLETESKYFVVLALMYCSFYIVFPKYLHNMLKAGFRRTKWLKMNYRLPLRCAQKGYLSSQIGVYTQRFLAAWL